MPWIILSIAALCGLAGIVILALATREPEPVETRCPKCRQIMLPEWDRCLFCANSQPPPDPALEFVSGPLTGKRIPLQGEVTTIGSGDGNGVVLTDPGVSRKHVGIRLADGQYELADLGSTNGVYVNGERLARKQLEVGDIIRVGSTEMVFIR